MNKIILSGRLTQDPEAKQTPNGAEMATFSVAVNRRRDRETTDFFKCVCFGQAAKYVTQYGSKGMSLELEGECQIHKYQDRNGNNQTTVNVVVDNLAFTSRNPQQLSSQPEPHPQQTSAAPQNNGNYQQRPQQQTPQFRNSAPIYQDACRSGQQQRNGFTPGGNGNYPAPPAYQQPKSGFLDVPEGVDDYPFN